MVWSIQADVCLCYKSEIIDQASQAIPEGLTLCCEQNLLFYGETSMVQQNGEADVYECPLDTHVRYSKITLHFVLI
jgi:hypothetical protein